MSEIMKTVLCLGLASGGACIIVVAYLIWRDL